MVVPPDILNEPELNTGSLDEGITNEGGQIQLVCIATGVPGKQNYSMNISQTKDENSIKLASHTCNYFNVFFVV